jgi:acetate kinase
MPPAAAAYPGPHAWWLQGIRRYGFHGISHRYVAQRAATLMGQPLADLKLVTCHLGNGCSLAAVAGGHSIDTTMGFTPLEGLMMGSRSGSVDPGVILHLLRQGDLTVDQLDRLLNKESGLKGISGQSNDLRTVQAAAEAGDERAQRAIAMFSIPYAATLGPWWPVWGASTPWFSPQALGKTAPSCGRKPAIPWAFWAFNSNPTWNAARRIKILLQTHPPCGYG